MVVGINANRSTFPPEGLFGGKDGFGTEYLVEDKGKFVHMKDYAGLISPTKGSRIPIIKEQEVIIKTPGGGGYGDPKDRDYDAVIKDLRDGYISRETAITEYGLDPQKADEIIKKFWFSVEV